MSEADEIRFACIGCGTMNPPRAEVCAGCGHRFLGAVGPPAPEMLNLGASSAERYPQRFRKLGPQSIPRPSRSPIRGLLLGLGKTLGALLIALVILLGFAMSLLIGLLILCGGGNLQMAREVFPWLIGAGVVLALMLSLAVFLLRIE